MRRRADEHKLGEALLATEMAVDHPEVARALVSDSLHRWTGRRRYFLDPAPALDAIWEHASALPRWQDAGATRDNAERRLRASRRHRGRPLPRHPTPAERDKAAAVRADGGLVDAAKPT
ncbi:hypothetical protein [Nocardia thailandica]